MKIGILPADDKRNGWSALLSQREAAPSLSKDIHADWAVVGAGYAGLAAARRLAELHPNQHIALIEAGEAGENASGRNSGFAIDMPHNVGSSLEELEGSQRFMRLARTAIESLDKAVKTHGIDCEWSEDGKYHAAVSERGAKEVLEPFAKELKALNEPFEWIEKSDLAKKLGTNHFTAAVYTPGGRLMNPAALTRGLADSLPENVTLYENSPVVEFHNSPGAATSGKNRGGIELQTRSGSIRAHKMIMATNGFSDQFGFYQNRFLHLVAHGSLTRPLTKEERKRFNVKKAWGLTPANAFAGITMRYTNDHRLLIRQGISYCPSRRFSNADLDQMQQKHQELFNLRFPQLEGVTIEHTWSGFLCLSRNSAPGFGKLADNIWSATCQNAVGVTKGTIGGMLVADMASGQDNPMIADMLSLGTPAMMPPRPFLDLGVRARFAWEIFNNRHEA